MTPARTIGALDVSVAGLGCNNLGWIVDASRSAAVVHAALEVGVTHFDTADVYGDGESERCLGAALGARRDQAVITTKFGAKPPPDGSASGSARWVRTACEASLRRLGTDHIDLYLQHYPDPETPIAETVGALAELRAAGKIREYGCSNLTAGELTATHAAARALAVPGPVAVQCSYSLLDRTPENDLIPRCDALGVGVLPYFPLANGLLTGKYARGAAPAPGTRLAVDFFGDARFPALRADACFDRVEALTAYATARGHTLLELALSWLASQRCVASVIAGATSPEQVRANAAAVRAWTLSDQDLREIARRTTKDMSFTINERSPTYATAPNLALRNS